MKQIELIEVTKSYPYLNKKGRKLVLDKVNLKFNFGEKIGILGLNGSGKSTLLRLIGNVTKPDSGLIIRNMSISWPLAFQGGFQGSLTGFDNLRFICRVYDVPWKEKLEKVQEIADLGEYFFEPVKTYSSGMRARLAFALSAVIDFDCYLIDEVVAVGDQRFKSQCLYEIFEKKSDRSYVIVSHQPSYIKEYCNRFFVLDKCHLIEFDDFDSALKYYSIQ